MENYQKFVLDEKTENYLKAHKPNTKANLGSVFRSTQMKNMETLLQHFTEDSTTK